LNLLRKKGWSSTKRTGSREDAFSAPVPEEKVIYSRAGKDISARTQEPRFASTLGIRPHQMPGGREWSRKNHGVDPHLRSKDEPTKGEYIAQTLRGLNPRKKDKRKRRYFGNHSALNKEAGSHRTIGG